MIRVRASLFVALAAGLVGCASNAHPAGDGTFTRADELREVGSIVTAHTTKGKKAAPTPAELAAYEQTFPLGVKALRAGDVVAVWGAKPTDEGAVAAGQGETAVIAYEKKAETEGGSVLLQDGSVKTMTATEFKAAPKAK